MNKWIAQNLKIENYVLPVVSLLFVHMEIALITLFFFYHNSLDSLDDSQYMTIPENYKSMVSIQCKVHLLVYLHRILSNFKMCLLLLSRWSRRRTRSLTACHRRTLSLWVQHWPSEDRRKAPIMLLRVLVTLHSALQTCDGNNEGRDTYQRSQMDVMLLLCNQADQNFQSNTLTVLDEVLVSLSSLLFRSIIMYYALCTRSMAPKGMNLLCLKIQLKTQMANVNNMMIPHSVLIS